MTTVLTSWWARLSQQGQRWHRFWFEPSSALSLGVLRWLIGGMILYSHFVWGLKLDSFFGPAGFQPAELVEQYLQDEQQFAFSLWTHIPDEHRWTFHYGCLAVLGLFMVGAVTPVTSVLAYVIVVSYAHRAPMANFGLDQMCTALTLYLAIGPSGHCLSVDALIRRLLGRPAPAPTARARLATRLIQTHWCIIYFFSGVSKLQGEAWWNGLALWQAAANEEYQSNDLTWLAFYPWLSSLLTHLTIIWELSFSFLIWNPVARPIMLLLGAGMHLGIGMFLGMWTFGLTMIFAYVSFVVPETWTRFRRSAPTDPARLEEAATDDEDLSTDDRPEIETYPDIDVEDAFADLPAPASAAPAPVAAPAGSNSSILDDLLGPAAAKPPKSDDEEESWSAVLTSRQPPPLPTPKAPAVAAKTPAVAENWWDVPAPTPSNGHAPPTQTPEGSKPAVEALLPPAVPTASTETPITVSIPTVPSAPTSNRPTLLDEPSDTPKLPVFRPSTRLTVIVVETRIQQLVQMQEYLLKNNIRCLAYVDHRPALALLADMQVDGFVVNAGMLADEEITRMLDEIEGHGPQAPGCLLILNGRQKHLLPRMRRRPAVRVLVDEFKLQNIRDRLEEILARPLKSNLV